MPDGEDDKVVRMRLAASSQNDLTTDQIRYAESVKNAKTISRLYRVLYDELIAVGFTAEQAMDLIEITDCFNVNG